MLLSNAEIKKELHETTRQCLTRHQFETWGDALAWLLNEDHGVLQQESGNIGYSKLSTEILWLVSLFGPKEKVDRSIFRVNNVPSLGWHGETPKETPIDEPEEDHETVKPARQQNATRRPRRKRY